MIEHAPGGPGIPPTWTSSAKDMVGCALGISRLWFTLGFGIVNEVYYPRVDIPQIRDLGFLIADGEGFWAEVKRIGNYKIRLLAPGVPAVEVVHEHDRFTLRLRIAPSVRRDVLVIECRLDGDPKLRPYALLAPHLGASGYGNRAAVVLYRRRRTCGPNKDRSEPRWHRWTRSSVMRSVGRVLAMSVAVTAGKTFFTTAK